MHHSDQIVIPPTAKQHHLNNPEYRADIDGLRAIAVLSIVGFHAFPGWVRWGFIGVDIFFVISGYLISSIIISSLSKGLFSFREFYARRIKRIFPALILVMATCYALGRFVLLPDEYAQLGKHIAAGAGFVSNFIFWRESGYFDYAAEEKLLLHLWSLGIEEQFYIAWPLLLYLAWKQRENVLPVIVSIGAISFAINVGMVSSDAVQSFYSPVSRIWELLVGSALAYISLRKITVWNSAKRRVDAMLGKVIYGKPSASDRSVLCNTRSVLGIVLIGGAVCFVTRDAAFPGWWALLPTLGTYLIISAGSQAWFNRVVLSHSAMVWFGLISYPLYLWHWPLLSFAQIIELGTPARGLRIAVVLCSIALAWLTYELIEKPVRFGRHSWGKVIVLSTLMIVVGCLGFYSYMHDAPTSEHAFTYVPNQYAYRARSRSTQECKNLVGITKGFCLIQDHNQKPTMALVGDSHANAIFGAVGSAASLARKNLILLGEGGCPPFVGVERDSSGCAAIMGLIVSFITNEPNIRTVVLTGRFAVTISGVGFGRETSPGFYSPKKSGGPSILDRRAIFEDGLEVMIAVLQRANKQVIIILDAPELNFDPKRCIPERGNEECVIARDVVDARQFEYREVISSLARKYPAMTVIDLMHYFCGDTECHAKSEGFVLYRDRDHLGINGNVYLVRHGFDMALAKTITATP